MRRGTFAALAALNLALLLALAWLWFTPSGELRNVRWQPPVPIKPALDAGPPLPQWTTDYARFVVTLDRPLFSVTRRPPVKPQEQPVDTLAEVTIVGIYGAGAEASVIARVGPQQVRRVKVGEALGGWTLKEVRISEAMLVRGGETRSLPIRRGAPSPNRP